jgi:hypothetical protein
MLIDVEETTLHLNSKWAINSRYITAVGQMIFGFDVRGNLWSHDSILHVDRDHQLQFPSISGITSDGDRLIFVTNGTITATTTDLLSFDPVQFEPFAYEITFDHVTAMSW